MQPIRYSPLEGSSIGFFILLGIFGLLALAGGGASYYMEHYGHYVTGMNNQIVWGLPHVFAIFLIVAASGALNVASISSVFLKEDYKPLARLSALMAIALLAGGLAVLVLDLGRPDRLIVAMTYYNFKSIFAWNIFLYTGFFVVVFIYMWTMFERRMQPYTRYSGMLAFIWRLILTTGTGSIFGFLIARQAYDAAVMAPLFISMSFSFGMAFFIVMLMTIYQFDHRTLGNHILLKLKNLLGVFIAATLYFVIVFNLTNLYAAEHSGIERFLLLEGGIYTCLFWGVQVVLGSIVPLCLFYLPKLRECRIAVFLGSLLVLVGAVAQIYVIVIGGQAYPLVLFPGMQESSSFFDGAIGQYTPSLPEWILSIGGVGLAIAIIIFALAVLDFLPNKLSDELFERSSK